MTPLAPKLSLLLLFLLFCAGRAAAQEATDFYYPYADRTADYTEQRQEPLLPDSTIFYRAIRMAPDIYSSLTDYRSGFVASKRRGQSWDRSIAWVEGLDLPYRYFSALRSLGAESTNFGGLTTRHAPLGSVGGVNEFLFSNNTPLSSRRASANFSDRNYRFGARFSATEQLGKGWFGSLSLDGRTGRDLYIDGVFTNATTSSFRASKYWHTGHSLDLMAILPASTRGVRSSSSAEAFLLTSNRLYNPSWGFQAGKVRNSRVRRDFLPLFMANGLFTLTPTTNLRTALSGEYGHRRYSSLGWYNARTPAPDNYRSMPSYSDDPAALDLWRAADPRYTQVNWDELILQNRMADSEAIYTLEDRTDRHFTMRLNAEFTTKLSSKLRLRYGLRGQREDLRSYKQMRDLLGAKYLTDIDQYLVDDQTFGNKLQNDLRNPNRKIGVGDRFGYDYSLIEQSLSALLLADYRSDRLVAELAAEISKSWAQRVGHFEKELFSASRSYGPSRSLSFNPYTLRAMVGYSFTPRNYLSITALSTSSAPAISDLFFQPQYNNLTLSNPNPQSTYAAQIDYRHQSRSLTLQLCAYLSASFNGLLTRRYFDDLSSQYANITVSSISQFSLGIEASAQIRLSDRWMLSAAASAGRYRYLRDALVDVIADSDNSTIDSHSRSSMKGLFIGGAPQLTSCLEVSYYAPHGWSFRASGSYAGLRYVEPSPLRRTSRIAHQAGSTPELRAAFVAQERLSDAFRLDASVFKSLYFGSTRLTVGLMVRNLLGDRNSVYDGYESMRIMRRRVDGDDLYSPQPSKYSYAYPRSFYLTISYIF